MRESQAPGTGRGFLLIPTDRRRGQFVARQARRVVIEQYLDAHNADPQIFTWSRDADTIRAKIAMSQEALGTPRWRNLFSMRSSGSADEVLRGWTMVSVQWLLPPVVRGLMLPILVALRLGVRHPGHGHANSGFFGPNGERVVRAWGDARLL